MAEARTSCVQPQEKKTAFYSNIGTRLIISCGGSSPQTIQYSLSAMSLTED
jgi:hypothetical protein